jgi:hypothetical protein
MSKSKDEFSTKTESKNEHSGGINLLDLHNKTSEKPDENSDKVVKS